MMKNVSTTIALSLSALMTTACAPALLQQQHEAIPALYQIDPAQQGAPVEYSEPMPGEPGSSLAPQELPREAATWQANIDPKAGPAPRNAISGGVLDVGVVPPSPQGTAQVGAPTHGIEPTDSGRLYILELYQEVLEQRDALQLEVNSLLGDLEFAQAEIAALRGTSQSEQSAVLALEQEIALLRKENADLVARLTTAQVRRLEAEKLLLETKIQVQRAVLDEEAPITSGIALSTERP